MVKFGICFCVYRYSLFIGVQNIGQETLEYGEAVNAHMQACVTLAVILVPASMLNFYLASFTHAVDASTCKTSDKLDEL